MTSAQHEQLARQIGQVLRARREQLGLTMDRVAGLADMTSNALWLNETGRRVPNSATLIKLAHALQMQDLPLSTFARFTYEPMRDGLPGVQLVIEAMRELLKAS